MKGKNGRLMSLDAFRGFDMFFIIGGALLLSLSSFFGKCFGIYFGAEDA